MWSWDQRQSSSALAPSLSYAAPTTDEDFLDDAADLFGAPSEDTSPSETHDGLLGLWSAFRDTAYALAQPQPATQDAETADMMEPTTSSEPAVAAAGAEQMRQRPPTAVVPATAKEQPASPVATLREGSAAPPESANDEPTLPHPDSAQEDTAMTGVVEREKPALDPAPSPEPTVGTEQENQPDLAATADTQQPPLADLIATEPTGELPEDIGDTHTTGIGTAIAGDGQQLVEEPTAGPMALDTLDGEHAWYGPADGQLANGLAFNTDNLDLAAAASVENRQCAFAKLEFPDGDFYMTTYAVELGRDARAFKQEMRRKLLKDDGNAERHRAVSVVDPPHTPIRPNAPSVVSVARSNLSECGGIMGGDDAHVNVSSRRKKKKKSKSASSSSQHPSRKSSLAAYPGTGTDYNSLALASLRNNGLYNQENREHTFLPDPYEVPLIPLHPPISEDGPAGHKGISRKHLKICYSFESNSFEMQVLGRNGAFLNGVIHTPNDPAAQLHDGDRIQIGHIPFMFRLPNTPMSDGEDGGESSDSFSGGISLNFEDGRGESIVVDESSDDDGYKLADQYSFSPHYGWPSEEEFSGEDMDEADDIEEVAPKVPKLKLKLGPKTKEQKREAREDARANKKKKKKKLKAEPEPKAPRKTVPKPAAKEKPSKKPKEESAQKTTVKETIEKPAKKPAPPVETQIKEEPVAQDTVIPNADVPQPSTEMPQQPEKSTSEKPSVPKTSGGFRVLTAEEAEKLGLEPGYVVERKKGPGRPPKDGIMSKREKAEIMRRKKEAEKAKKLGLNPEEIAKIDLSKPRKEPKEGEPKPGAEKKPKSAEAEGAASESAPPEDGSQTAEKKPAKTPRPVRSPSPEMKESDYTEEQLQRPAANYVVLIHEAISNSRDGKLNLQQIYSAIERKYPYYKFKTSTTGWQSSVRHNLGQHDAFRKAEKEGKGWMWAINPGVSIEKERRKRNTPPPPSQPPRPYYQPLPPHGQSPYMMAPPGVPNYHPHASPYGPRPPAINGAAPAAAPGQPAYQSPYAPRPAGQAGQATPQPRPSPYGPVGVRSPYQPYGYPPTSGASPYAPPTSSSSMPSASGSIYPTAGPSPYQSTAAYTPGHTSTAGQSPYPPRPPYPQQPSQASPAQAAGSLATQQSGHPGAPAPPHPTSLTQTPLPPRKSGIYEGTEKWAMLLDNFRRLFIQGTTTRGWQGQERIDRLAAIVDRGMERALHPHRFAGEPEPKNEEETLDRKEERQVVDAVYEMLRKHYGITDPPGLFRQPGAQQQQSQPQPSQPSQTPTGQQPAAVQLQSQAQVPPNQVPPQPTQPPPSPAPQPTQSQQTSAHSIPGTQPPPGPPPSNSSASGPPQTAPSAAPVAPANVPPAPTSHPNTPTPNISSEPPSTAVPTPATTAAAPPPTNPPQPNGASASVSVGTPRAPEVEALTPVEGMSKPGTPASGTGPSSVPPAPPPTAAAAVTGIKRGPDGDAVGGAEQEAKKVKVEGDA